MHPRLIKVSIPKSSLADRDRVSNWLRCLEKEALLPKERGTPDAMRVAIAYVLRDWSSWKGDDGTVYRAIAAAPTEQKGLMLNINVQERKPDGVQYSETICTLSAEDDGHPLRCTGSPDSVVYKTAAFRPLYEDLEPWKLKDLGTNCLFDHDLRNIAEGLLEGSVDKLWKGVWLCLGNAPALEEVATLGTLVSAGSVTLSTLTLDQSESNRLMLADELAKEYLGKFERLTKRLALPRPNLEAIEQDYMAICFRIRQAEEMLGVKIPCLSEQIAFEEVLASTPD